MSKIFFKNSKGKTLSGIYYENNSDTAVLVCHGLGSHKGHPMHVVLQEQIFAAGFSVLGIDLTGHGESEGEYNDLTLTQTIDDILSAKKELLKLGYKNVGFVGHSFGGVGGIMVAPEANFKFMVLISPPTHYDISEMISSGIYVLWELRLHNKESENKKAKIKIKFFRDYGSHDSYVAAEKIKIPVLIIHGDDDKIVPLDKSKELHKRIKNSEMIIFKGCDHHFKRPGMRDKLLNEVVKFVKKYNSN